MTDENKSIDISKNDTQKNPFSSHLFSKNEIRTIVKNFIHAYINNHVQINFPDADEVKRNFSHQKMSGKIALDFAVEQREKFSHVVMVCCGVKESTEEERKKALTDVFDIILLARTNGRLRGSIEDYELKEKIDDLEEKLLATNNVVKQLVTWLTETEKGHDKGLP